MEARFIGDPRHNGHGPSVIRLFDAVFPKGKWVTGLPETHRKKIEGNNHFQVRDDGSTVEPESPTVEVEAYEDAGQDVGAAPVPADKTEIMARLDAMEIKYDSRLGAPKLRSILEAAEFERGEDDD